MSEFNPTQLTAVDLRLVEDLIKNGPRVTIREIMRRHGIFPSSDSVRRRPNTLARAGLGTWQHSKPGPEGGRPRQFFLLTAPTTEVEKIVELMRRGLCAQPSKRGRSIHQDLTALLNRHARLSSERLAKTFQSVTASLISNANHNLDSLPRKYRVTERGFETRWGD